MVNTNFIGAGGVGYIRLPVLYNECIVIIPVTDNYFYVLVQRVYAYLFTCLLNVYVTAFLVGIIHPHGISDTQNQRNEYKNKVVS